MARPTKYDATISEGIAEMVKKGHTLRAVAKYFGISEASISRWRLQYPDFNKALTEATQEQQNHIRSIKKAKIRTYTRKCYISPYYDQKPRIGHSDASEAIEDQHTRPTSWLGLPIMPRPLEYEPTSPYLDPNTDRVEWIDKANVLHSCPMEVWQAKYQPQHRPFMWEII